jgi:hypothetical protein
MVRQVKDEQIVLSGRAADLMAATMGKFEVVWSARLAEHDAVISVVIEEAPQLQQAKAVAIEPDHVFQTIGGARDTNFCSKHLLKPYSISPAMALGRPHVPAGTMAHRAIWDKNL